MDVLVKFVAIENKKDIENYFEYINKIYEELRSSKLINGLIIKNPLCLDAYSPVESLDEESNHFRICFNGIYDDKSNNWEILFRFGTYKKSKQLLIEIASDTYSVDVKDSFLEKLKLNIKTQIVSDWGNIIWLFDKDSEALSISLYPKFYETENSLRQLINEVMEKEFGTQWWDKFTSFDIKKKHVSRRVGYKSAVSAFNNVDEKLMSIDVNDLLKIITLKKKKWKAEYSDKINLMLSDSKKCDEKIIIEELKSQLEVEVDLWESCFSNYLSDEFVENYKTFSSYRNHIAHNKLIDRTTYSRISESVSCIYFDAKEAIKLINGKILSDEEKINIKQREEEEYYELQQLEHDFKEIDANISIRSDDEICELYESKINQFMDDLKENMIFRSDIELKDNLFDCSNMIGDLFNVESIITKDQLNFKYSLDINSEEGGESILNITDENDYSVSVTYTNGEVEFDAEQGIYMPLIDDEFSDKEMDFLLDSIIDHINENLPDIREMVNAEAYEMGKNGGESPISEEVICSECGGNEVYIRDDIVPFGTCLSCGYVNDQVVQCEKCGIWFNPEYEGEVIDDICICQSCLDRMREE